MSGITSSRPHGHHTTADQRLRQPQVARQNALTGHILLTMFRLPRLSKLLFIDNVLSGKILLKIGNCTSLVQF
jgi:hypothetical protein